MANLSFINVADFNKVLRSEVFMSEERQLKAVHLILDFKPLFDKFQDSGHAIRAGNNQLARIKVPLPGVLAPEDIVLVELPSLCSPREAAVLREETASSRLSLEAEINQFHLEEEEQEKPVIQVSDLKGELDKSFVVHSPKFIVA